MKVCVCVCVGHILKEKERGRERGRERKREGEREEERGGETEKQIIIKTEKERKKERPICKLRL